MVYSLGDGVSLQSCPGFLGWIGIHSGTSVTHCRYAREPMSISSQMDHLGSATDVYAIADGSELVRVRQLTVGMYS